MYIYISYIYIIYIYHIYISYIYIIYYIYTHIPKGLKTFPKKTLQITPVLTMAHIVTRSYQVYQALPTWTIYQVSEIWSNHIGFPIRSHNPCPTRSREVTWWRGSWRRLVFRCPVTCWVIMLYHVPHEKPCTMIHYNKPYSKPINKQPAHFWFIYYLR
jgi:hypothetical protein